jgi:hypothetical protein
MKSHLAAYEANNMKILTALLMFLITAAVGDPTFD